MITKSEIRSTIRDIKKFEKVYNITYNEELRNLLLEEARIKTFNLLTNVENRLRKIDAPAYKIEELKEVRCDISLPINSFYDIRICCSFLTSFNII